jgi:predicted ATP-grasp superfamily ATP-dependent carboligase
MISSYSAAHPDMIKEYLLNRNIDKLPTHHSGVSAHITDATTGADLEGATLAVNGKTTTSDIDGIAEIVKVKPATYNVTVSLAGYASQTMKITIVRGKVTELEIKLVK